LGYDTVQCYTSISVFRAEVSHVESSWVCREKAIGYSRENGAIRAIKEKERWGPDGSMGTLVPENNNDLRTGGMEE
jgi:hypothetical protein